MKVLAVAIFMGSAMSIASIADVTFQMRGFLVNAIEFYRLLTEPLMLFLSRWITLEQYQVDGAIFMILFTGARIRAEHTVEEHYHSERPQMYPDFFKNKIFRDMYMVLAGLILFLPLIFMGKLATWLYLGFLGLSALNMVVGPTAKRLAKMNPYMFRVARSTVSYLLAILLFTAIVAGISEGLTRIPAP